VYATFNIGDAVTKITKWSDNKNLYQAVPGSYDPVIMKARHLVRFTVLNSTVSLRKVTLLERKATSGFMLPVWLTRLRFRQMRTLYTAPVMSNSKIKTETTKLLSEMEQLTTMAT
ncbi:MAG: hypothetical protein K2F74_00235, partial [Muribaculaceae bacterium]|nr:hypothetical protein [Muribaculaceae bacterium]